MSKFEELKTQWGNQKEAEIPQNGANEIRNRIVFIQKKQRITNGVLAATIVVLLAFFFYVSAYRFQSVMVGLLLMIGALATRIGLEVSSIRSLKNMNVSTTVETFKNTMIRYYKRRTKVHFIATPIIVLVYCVGFGMLLPAFKERLTSGFYLSLIHI